MLICYLGNISHYW